MDADVKEIWYDTKLKTKQNKNQTRTKQKR